LNTCLIKELSNSQGIRDLKKVSFTTNPQNN